MRYRNIRFAPFANGIASIDSINYPTNSSFYPLVVFLFSSFCVCLSHVCPGSNQVYSIFIFIFVFFLIKYTEK